MSIEIPNKVYSNKTGKFVDIKIFDLFLGKWQNIISDVNGDKDRFVVTNCEEEDKEYKVNGEKVRYKLKKITCKSYSYTLSKKTIDIAEDTCGQLYHDGGVVNSSKGGVTIARQDDADGFLELFQEVGYTIDHIDNNARYEESNVKTKYTAEVANELVLDNIQRGSTIFNVDTNIECKDNNTVELNVDYLHFLRKGNSGKLYDDMTILENKLGHIYMNITHIRAVYTSCQKYSDCIRYYITLKDGTVLEKDCECPYLVGLTLNVKDIKLQYTNGDMSVENILKYRILEKGTYSYLAIIQDFIEKAFNTVVIFDDVNFKISVYDRATYGARTGIEFSYDTFVKSINKNKLYDNIINKLIVEGENASIINENPLGTNYIYNFDYHEKYGLMSDGLLSAWHTYKTIVSQNGTALHDAREDLKNYNNRIIQLQAMIIQSKYQLNNYNIQLSSLLQNNKDGQFNDQISELNSKIQNENNKLNDLNSRLSLNETEKTSVQLKIKELCDKVSVENATDSDGNKIFTDNLLKEFKALIVEERLQDSFYDTNVGLMEYSTNYIAEKNKLDIEYTINNKEIIANMHIPEGLSWNYYFSVGNFVEVKDILVDGDYTKEEARVIEIDYNPYKNQIKSMTHSTKDEKYDELNNVQSISESISRSNTYINSYKPYWEMSEDMADKLARLEEMIAANGGSISGVSANGTIGGSGMDIAKYDTIMARLAAFDEIFAGNITADMIQAGAIIADKIAAHSITADKIATDVLKASNIQFDTASGNVMDLQTLLAQFGLFSNEQVLHLTAENVVLDEAIIKDAMIDSLSASKLLAGEINTAKIKIHGQDGRLSIVDNTLQIEDENHVVRLQLGLDATGGYSFNIWNEDGTLQWTSKGLTADGMQPEIIRDIHVAEDANINGHKIDINTLVENFNDNCTKTLSSTKISMGGQTLEAYLQSMTQTIEGTAGGGKNILLNSQLFVDDNWTENNFTKVRLQDPEDNVDYIKVENTSGQIAFTEYIPANVFKYMDKFYTFSVYIYGERGKSVRIGSRTKYLEYKFGKDGWERLHFTFFIRGISDDTVTFQDGKFMFTEDELCLYQENNKYDGYPLVDENTVCIQFLNDGLYKFKKPQLEIGMAASAYSLCPDDTIDAIETNKAAIKIEKDRMDQLLAKTTITKKNGEVVGIEDSYNETIRTIDTLETMIADNKTLIDENTNNVKAVRNISNYTKDTLDMFLKVLIDNNITFENAIKTTKTNTNMIEMLKNGTQFKVTESIVKELLQGTEYREVSAVYPEYYFSDSSSTLSSGNWSTEYQQWQDGKYIWGRTIAQYKDGSINIGEPKMIFTATAKRIESISLLYYVSSSNAELTEGEWKQSCPEWEYGKYLWTKFKIVYKTDEEVITKETEPVLEYSWLPSQQLQTSNGNLLLNTQLKDDSNWVATDCTKDITLANISTMNISSVDKGCIKYQPATVCSTKGDYVFSAYLQGNSGNKIKLIICNDNTEDNSTCNIVKTFTLKNSAFNRLILPFHIKSSDEVITENSIYEINDDKNYNIDDSFIKVPVIDKKDKLTVKIQFVNSGDYKFKMPQLEYGITATDYRPNSKDLLDTLEKHETQININTNGISTLVSSQKDMQKSISTLEQTSDSFKTKIEANEENITDMGSKVTNNTSEITQLKDKIELKIDETTVETMINNVQVGARNLVRNSAFINDLDNWNVREWSSYFTIDNNNTLNGHKSLKISATGLTENKWIGVKQNLTTLPLRSGETYYISCWYYCTDKTTFDNRFALELKGRKEGATSDETIYNVIIASDKLIENKWTRISGKITLKDDWKNAYIYTWVEKNGVINVTDIMVSKTNVLTDWTPAPEDVQEQINTCTTQLNAHQGYINTLVKNTTITKDGKNITLKDAYSDLIQEIDGISLKANEAETTVKNFTVGSANMLQNGALEKSLEFWITDILDDYIKFVESHAYIDLSKLSGAYSISQSVPINTDSTYGAQINVISLKKNLILRVIASNAKGEVVNQEEYIIDKTGVSYVYIKAEKASYLKYELILNGGEIYELYHAQLERGNVISDFKESDNDTNLKFKRTENSIETVDAKNSQLNVKVDGIDSHVSNIQKTVNYHGDDIVTMQAQISEVEQKITPDAIVSTVTKSKIYTDNLNGKVDTSTYQSKITQLATMIEQRVKNSDYESKISQLADSISSKVESDKLSSLIKQNIDSVAYAFNGYSPSVTVKKDGLHLYNCGLSVKIGADDSTATSLWIQTNGLIGSYTGYGVYSKSSGYGVHYTSTGAYACPRESDGATGPFYIHTNDRVVILNSGGTKDKPNMGSDRMGITAGSAIFDTLWVKGSKTRAVKFSDGEYYGYNAVESAECYFSDEGKAVTNQNGECEITLDKKFLEGVNTKDYDYNIFLTKYGKGDIWVEEQSSNSFLVKSDKPNLKFTWIVHCKQRDYETVRLQKANKEDID